MSDTRKIVNTREPRRMTQEQEDAVLNAFERFQPERSTTVQVPKRDHLATSWKKGYCCKHSWKDVFLDADVSQTLQKKFDEEELGQVRRCIHCEALSLWEDGKLWAYDALELVNDEPVKESRQSRKGRR